VEFARKSSTTKSRLKLSSQTVEIADCYHKFLELGDLFGRDFGSFNMALGIDTVFEAVSLDVPGFQVICCLTSLFLKVPTHVSQSFNLNSGHGDSFLMNLLTCFFLPFLPPSFLVATAAPAVFAASASFCLFGMGGQVNDDRRFNSKVPKQTLSMRWWQSRMLSLILSLRVAVMQSSSQSWKGVSTAYMNLHQNSVLVWTWALNDCLDHSTSWIMEVMA
jgi:hypothetical protein